MLIVSSGVAHVALVAIVLGVVTGMAHCLVLPGGSGQAMTGPVTPLRPNLTTWSDPSVVWLIISAYKNLSRTPAVTPSR